MGQRGRKKGASGEQSRALLLAIAAEEFAEKGYYAAKVSRIVERANLTQPSFYLYFESKESVFQELVESFRSRLTGLAKPAAAGMGLERKMRSTLEEIFNVFSEHPALTKIGLFSAPQSGAIKEELATQFVENLRLDERSGNIHSDLDYSLVAESMVGSIESLTDTRLLTGQMSPKELAEEITGLYLYGIAAGKWKNVHRSRE